MGNRILLCGCCLRATAPLRTSPDNFNSVLHYSSDILELRGGSILSVDIRARSRTAAENVPSQSISKPVPNEQLIRYPENQIYGLIQSKLASESSIYDIRYCGPLIALLDHFILAHDSDVLDFLPASNSRKLRHNINLSWKIYKHDRPSN